MKADGQGSIPRIGRPQNAAERAVARAREIRAVGEYHGQCLYAARKLPDEPCWMDLSPEQQASWVLTAIQEMEQHAMSYRPPDPDPEPDGGLPLEWVS